MKLEKICDEYHFYSGKASDIARQLAFAGIAIIWIFKNDHPGKTPTVPHALIWPTMILAITLLCDFFQYVYGWLAYWIFHANKEKKKQDQNLAESHDFKVPSLLIYPMDFLFAMKITGIIAAYIFLATFLYRQLFI